MKSLLLGLLGAVLLVLVIVLARAFLHTPEITEEIALVDISLDERAVAERLAQAIRFRTVSHQRPEEFEADQFTGFIDWVNQQGGAGLQQ